VTTDINTVLTALYVKIDDWLGKPPPGWATAKAVRRGTARHDGRPSLARDPFRGPLAAVSSQAPTRRVSVPAGQSGYNERMRTALPLLKKAIQLVAADTDLWFT
jgi:hypothetical protein